MPQVRLHDRRLVAYEERRQGPEGGRPVLFVHRAGGSAADWARVIDLLGPAVRSVALELPGHGGSPGPAATTIAEMAEIVIELAEALDLDRPLLVGHSMGGAVALEAAIGRPELGGALLMVSAGATLRVSRQVLGAVRDYFDDYPRLMVEMSLSRAATPETVERARAELFASSREVVLADLEACDRWTAEPRLAALRVPTTLLTGKDDQMTPPRLARRMAERVRGATLELIPNAGHLLPLEAPDRVAEAVRRVVGEEG